MVILHYFLTLYRLNNQEDNCNEQYITVLYIVLYIIH